MKLTNREFSDYLKENYYKENQKLNIQSWYDIEVYKQEGGKIYDLELYYKDYSFLDIRTLDIVPYSQLGHIPYCIKQEWGVWLITVQKFGELNNQDISKAISYVLYNILDIWSIFNIYFEGKQIETKKFNSYIFDSDTLREDKKYGK